MSSWIHVWAPLSFENKLLKKFNIGVNLPPLDGEAMKSTLTLLFLCCIEGGFIHDYPNPNLFSTEQGQPCEGGSSHGPTVRGVLLELITSP